MICSPKFINVKNNSICSFQCHPNRSYYCPNKCQTQCYIPPPIKCNSFILNCTPCNKFPHSKQSCNWWKHFHVKPKTDTSKIPEIWFSSNFSPQPSINCKIQCPTQYNQEIPSFTHEHQRLGDKREVKNFSSAKKTDSNSKKPPSEQKYISTKEKTIFQTLSTESRPEFKVSEQCLNKFELELKAIPEIYEEKAYIDKFTSALYSKKNGNRGKKRETKTENSHTKSSNTQRTTGSIKKEKIANNSPQKDKRKPKSSDGKIESEKSKQNREILKSSSIRSNQSKLRPIIQNSVIKKTKDYRQQVKHERIMHTFEKRRVMPENNPKHQIQPKNNPKGQIQPRNNPKGQIQPKNNPKGQIQPKNNPKGQIQPKNNPKGQIQPKNNPKGQIQPKNNPKRQIQPKNNPKREKAIKAFHEKEKLNKVNLSAFGSSYGSDKIKSQICFKQPDLKCKPFNLEFRPLNTKICGNLKTLPSLNPNIICRNISYSCLPVKCKPVEKNTKFGDSCVNTNLAAYLCNLSRYNIPYYPKNPICTPGHLTGLQCTNPLNNKYCTSIINGPYLHLNK